MLKANVGIVGTGLYIPQSFITAKEVSEATKGRWTEAAVVDKLGFRRKPVPGQEDGTQEMGVNAALDCLKRTNTDPLDIDLILCIGEEWKEYPLTTSGIYIQERIGAYRAWAIDIQQRCCTCVAAMKIAKDMMLADNDINTVMIVGGYRNGDFIDYENADMSMMYNLGAGAGALILKKNYNKNLLLGTHIMTDGSLARDVGVRYGGTIAPVSENNLHKAYKSLEVFDAAHMKDRLNQISMKNWFECIDKAFKKSGIERSCLNYLAVLHFKRSMHLQMLEELGLQEAQSVYLEDYGHIGQIDQILSLQLGLESERITEGSVIAMIAAGIGYAWAANVIKWGNAE
ncbi:MAG: 3-oxoacyl-ACP synthase [Bacillota bacterium]